MGVVYHSYKISTNVLWIRNCRQKCQRAAGGCCMCTQQMAALFCMTRRHERHLDNLTSYQEIGLGQSIHNYLKNNPDKFRPDLIWNEGALDYFEEIAPKKKNNKMNKISSDMGSVPDQKISIFNYAALCSFSSSVTMIVQVSNHSGVKRDYLDSQWRNYRWSFWWSPIDYTSHHWDMDCWNRQSCYQPPRSEDRRILNIINHSQNRIPHVHHVRKKWSH